MPETVGDRVRMIREERGEKQPAFAAALTEAAKRLDLSIVYDNTMVSKMEVGRRDVDLNDVRVIASVDKQQRGREWLAWGWREVLSRRQHPKAPIEANELTTVDPHSAPPRRVVGHRRRDR